MQTLRELSNMILAALEAQPDATVCCVTTDGDMMSVVLRNTNPRMPALAIAGYTHTIVAQPVI